MQRSMFQVLFYVKRQSEKHGQVPVMGRITINGTMSQFSCKLSVRASLWDAKANKASGKSLEAQRINEKLENIKTNIGKQYQRLCDRDSYVSAKRVRNAFLGMGDDCHLLLQTFDEYLAGFLKRVGKDRAYSSYKDYCKRHRRLAVFLKYEYHSLRLRPSALRPFGGSLPVAGEEEHRFGIFGPLPRIEDLENRASLPLGPDNLETRGVGRRIDRDREIVERSRVPASAGCEQQGRSGKKERMQSYSS